MSTADHCTYCQELFGKKNLRKCSGCHLVRYCSKDCQRKAWPMHKRSCVQGSELRRAAEADPEIEELASTVSKWLACWRGTLFTSGMMAMDLANRPRDWLATHVVFIELERRKPRPKDRARLLRMRGGKVMARSECANALRYLEMSDAHIEEWKKDCRGERTLQITLVCEDHTRTLWASFQDLRQYWDIEKDVSAKVGREWESMLMEQIELGEPNPA